MLNFFKIIELLISLLAIYISTMVPSFLAIPFNTNLKYSFELPITLQVPTIILISLIFNRRIVHSALTIYLLLGLFIIPVFHEGGSLGYLLSPNFGYLVGYYPLVKTIGYLNRNNKIYMIDFLKSGILGIFYMHMTGILYSFLQVIYFKQLNIFLYNLGNYSIGMIGYHFLMLFPIMLLIKPINFLKTNT